MKIGKSISIIVKKIAKFLPFNKYHIYLIVSKHKFSKEKIEMLKKGKAHLRRNPIQKTKEYSGKSGLLGDTGLAGIAETNYKE